MIYAVIGANYGDEGKGLATDYLSMGAEKTLVVRHNGGAQSGHTVETQNGKRFVFHEIGSGSFRGADTFWAESFMPDMYKLDEEAEAFFKLSGCYPKIYASPECCITTIDDVLVNMLLEDSRGDSRHGSCGMGINECDLRSKAGYKLTLSELFSMDEKALYNRLLSLRKSYTTQRLIGLDLADKTDSEYYQMLYAPEVLINFAERVIANRSYIKGLCEAEELFDRYSNIVFETGQGLRLDSELEENQPNVTASRTGLTNILHILDKAGKRLDEVVYVTRSYMTKHGAGKVANEDSTIKQRYHIDDKTNIPNEWQGTLRYLRWDSPEDMLRLIRADKALCRYSVRTSLMITHLNETDDRLLFEDSAMPLEELINSDLFKAEIDRFYLSDTRFSEDIRIADE